MRVEYSGKNLTLTEAIREKTAKKLKKLERFTGIDSSAHVSFEVERHQHRIDLVIRASHDRVFKATSSAEDLYGAISSAADAIEQQAKREKEKRIRRGSRKRVPGSVEAESAEEPAEEPPKKAGRGSSVIRRPDLFVPKPLSLEDALLLLEERKEPALVFSEADGQFSVLVRKSGGEVFLIEPNQSK
jgi:putative sigma-54 modulation protein